MNALVRFALVLLLAFAVRPAFAHGEAPAHASCAPRTGMATNERAVQASSATHSPGHASRAACMTDAACGAACASAGAAGRNGEPALASLGHVRRAHTATLALGTSAAPPLRPPRRT